MDAFVAASDRAEPHIMNIANRLTLSRLALAEFFVVVMTVRYAYSFTFALVIFIVAGITDYWDGKIARKYAMTTHFGALIDPLVDKILVSSALIFFLTVPFLAIPAWTVIVIISREFAVTGLRLVAASRGKVLPAVTAGKHKTAVQIATVIVILVYLSLRELAPSTPLYSEAQLDAVSLPLILAMMLISAVLTVYSGLMYLLRNKDLLLEDV